MHTSSVNLLGLFLIYLCLMLGTGHADTGEVRVIDGDTIAIGHQHIRLEGIDAPELRQDCYDNDGEIYSCGRAAKAHLARLIHGRKLHCNLMGNDKYERKLGICFTGRINLNENMVADGWALAYRQYSTRYAAAEEEAKWQRLGIWQGRFIVPWQ